MSTEHMIQDTTLQALGRYVRDLTKNDEPLVGVDLLTELERCCAGLVSANKALRRKNADGLTEDVGLPELAEYIAGLGPADITVRIYDEDDTQINEIELKHCILGDAYLVVSAGIPMLTLNHGQAYVYINSARGLDFWGLGPAGTVKPLIILNVPAVRLDIWNQDVAWNVIPYPTFNVTVWNPSGTKRYISTAYTGHMSLARCGYNGGVWPGLLINNRDFIAFLGAPMDEEIGEPIIKVKGLALKPNATDADIIIPWGDTNADVDIYEDVVFYTVEE